MRRGKFGGKGRPLYGICIRTFCVSLPKRLNRSIYRLNCGLGWAEGSTSSIVFARWRQCAHTGGHIGTTWQIRLNRPTAAAMRSYVKLHWPLDLLGMDVTKLSFMNIAIIIHYCFVVSRMSYASLLTNVILPILSVICFLSVPVLFSSFCNVYSSSEQ